MKLADKGPMAPLPVLSAYPQTVSAAIQQWKGIIAAAHWDLHNETRIDGADFYVGNEELGHIHLDGSVHLATVKELRVPLVSHKLAEKFPYGGTYDGWVLFNITTEADAVQAIWLFKLNYQRLTGVAMKQLINTITKHNIEPNSF